LTEQYQKPSKDVIESVIRRAEEMNGKVEFQVPSGYRFYTTIGLYKELADANFRDQRSILTKILRKSPMKHASDYPDDKETAKYRKIDGWLAFYLQNGGTDRIHYIKRYKYYEISLGERNGKTHVKLQAPPRMNQPTVLDKLRNHWMSTESHSKKEKLFGIELEFCTEQKHEEKTIQFREGQCEQGCCPGEGDPIEKIVKIPLPTPKFKEIELLVPGLRMKTDTSVKPSCSDAQEANLLMGPNGLSRLRRLCKEIRDRGGFVNKTCGLHVHLDARDNDRRVVGIRASKLHEAMPILLDLVPDSRFKFCQCPDESHNKKYNHYCRIEKPSFDADKYMAINLESYRRYKTIEVRMGAGSLNPTKIWHWARLLFEISNSKNRYPTWTDFLKSDIPLYLRMWAVVRADELRPNESLERMRMDTLAPGLLDLINSSADSEIE